MKEEIIVFGRGQYYVFKSQALRDKYKISYFADNNVDMDFTDNQIDDINVINAKCLDDTFSKKILVMTSRKSCFIIAKQLLEQGITADKILLGCNIKPAFDKAEELVQAMGKIVINSNGSFGLITSDKEYTFHDTNEYVKIIKKINDEQDEYSRLLPQMPVIPASRAFGREFGNPIDRYYIDDFLSRNSSNIHGDVFEISENTYTKKYGQNVETSNVIHVSGWGGSIKGNLETGEGIVSNSADCLICTQTIQCIYRIKDVARNIYRMLKPGGSALITAHGNSPLSMGDYLKWGEYWRFTDKSLKNILIDGGFSQEKIEIKSYGNVKTVICFMYGLSQEHLNKEDFEYNDKQFPLIFGILCKK